MGDALGLKGSDNHHGRNEREDGLAAPRLREVLYAFNRRSFIRRCQIVLEILWYEVVWLYGVDAPVWKGDAIPARLRGITLPVNPRAALIEDIERSGDLGIRSVSEHVDHGGQTARPQPQGLAPELPHAGTLARVSRQPSTRLVISQVPLRHSPTVPYKPPDNERRPVDRYRRLRRPAVTQAFQIRNSGAIYCADRSAAADRERSLERRARGTRFRVAASVGARGFVDALLVGELTSGAVSLALTTIVLIAALFLLLHFFRPTR